MSIQAHQTLPIDPQRRERSAATPGSDVRTKTRATDKSVRGNPVKAKVKDGVVTVENPLNGVTFGFPAACWPRHWNKATNELKQLEWITRLTPWWDGQEWTPLAHRLRESIVKAINKLTEQKI